MKGDISRDTFDATKHYSGVVMQQGRVQLDADWNEQQSIHRHRAETQAKDVIGASGAPQHDAGFQLTTDGRTLTIGKGRYYVHGLLCENEAKVDYLNQPDFPKPPVIADLMNATGATAMILYLCVWRRAITALEDPSIREAALGGPDTALRVKTVWQVKALPVRLVNTASAPACGDGFPEWDALVAPGTGLMSARAQPVQPTDSPCLLPPSAGYRRLENQLYRVEVHKAGPLATATFKWSRDNGAVVTAVEKFNGQELTVHDLGRDETLGFSNGQTVELLDDATELFGQPGPLLQIDHVDEATRRIVLRTAPAAIDLALRPRLRRWDSAGDVPLAVPTVGSGFVALEDGVEVKFEAGDYRTGDYWLIPARTVTGGLDWPFTAPQPPRGEQRHYSRLAVASFASGTIQGLQDCRPLFSPLAEIPPALHVTRTSWVNDDDLDQALLLTNGLQIFIDGPLTPPSTTAGAEVLNAVLTVTMEAPILLPGPNPSGLTPLALQAITLSGDIDFPAPSVIEWKPKAPGSELSNLSTYLVQQPGQAVLRVRVRVRLRGGGFWQESASQRVYIDGRAVGADGFRHDGTTPRVDLQFPSGEGRRASDFESWFYLRLQPPQANLVGVTVEPAIVNAGGNAQGTVFLDFPAPDGGLAVALKSSQGVATPVPNNVVVPKNDTQAPFNVTTAANASNTVQDSIIATAKNVAKNAPVTVQVVSVAISPAAVTLFPSQSQQFSATVAGAGETGVTWSVQEPNGGNVTASGLYFAPATTGVFHVIATSAANPAKTVAATVTVHTKTGKEGKDGKDGKEAPEKLTREKNFAKESGETKVRLHEAKATEVVSFAFVTPGASPAVAMGFEKGDESAPGRAFIRPSERPDLTPRATP
ncbi:MAG: hypothetical protein HYS06_07260 [Methylocystis sp.]|nr:hypothetical protein [Methylocystis sp.]